MKRAAKNIDTHTIIQLKDGKPAQFIRKGLLAIYEDGEGKHVGRKVRADDEFEILMFPAQMANEMLSRFTAQIHDQE